MKEVSSFFTKAIPILLSILIGVSTYFMIVFSNRKLEGCRKINIKKKNFIIAFISIIVIVIATKIFINGEFIRRLTFTLFISIIVAYTLNPIVKFFEKKKLNKTLSILIVFVLIIGVVSSLFIILGPRISKEISILSRNLPSYIDKIYNFSIRKYKILSGKFDIPTFDKMIDQSLTRIKDNLLSGLINMARFFSRTISRVSTFILIPIFTFYFLKDKEIFKKKIIELTPKKMRKDLIDIGNEVDRVIGRYIKGQLIVCTFVGVGTSIILSIIGVNFSILIGIFAGITNIIPYLGPFVGGALAVIFAALDDPSKIIWVIIGITIVQQLESSFVSPNVVGNSVGLHPIVVMLSVLIAGSYFGVLGMILAVPTVSTIRILYKFLKKKIENIKDDNILPD